MRPADARVRRLLPRGLAFACSPRGQGTPTSASVSVLACGLLLSAGCTPALRPGDVLPRRGQEIVVCGQLVHVGAPVVLWLDPGGYDAYRIERRFEPGIMPKKPVSSQPARYGSLRRNLPPEIEQQVREHGWSVDLLARCVDQFVMHYDVCGTSRRCFQVLHDVRGLSVHFMLDVDGTIYQTLDLKERAWHAGIANDRSIGIEIANIGAYEDMTVLRTWYARDLCGRTYIRFPPSLRPLGIRTPGFVARPARNDPVVGVIQGRRLIQYDFTPQQYASLARLVAAVHRVLPKIRLEYPRNPDGSLRTTVLSREDLDRYSGLLGHWHVSRHKVDPGPAFDWERLIREAKRELR